MAYIYWHAGAFMDASACETLMSQPFSSSAFTGFFGLDSCLSFSKEIKGLIAVILQATLLLVSIHKLHILFNDYANKTIIGVFAQGQIL